MVASGVAEAGLVNPGAHDSSASTVDMCPQFKLLWCYGICSTALSATGCEFDGVIGLTQTNRQLLRSLNQVVWVFVFLLVLEINCVFIYIYLFLYPSHPCLCP